MITDVSQTPATGTAAADAAMKKSAGMNKDDFLKLFVTQMQNQDPLNPQDSTQFITQLAQLTSVEQAYNANTNLQNILSQGSNATTLGAISLIGKQIEATGSQVALAAGSPSTLNFNLAQGANQVTISIRDASGTVVKTLTTGATASGKGSLSWDGTTTGGSTASPGVYSFSVSAVDAAGNKITAEPFVKGVVNSVDMTGTTPTLNAGGIALSLTDVTSVGGV